MIVVDSSAVVAIALDEDESTAFFVRMKQARTVISSATLLETHMVLAGRNVQDPAEVTAFILQETETQIVSFEVAHATAAFEAFKEFGKGHHPAALNFGDCIAFGTARALGASLLYKGKDFARTSIRSALR